MDLKMAVWRFNLALTVSELAMFESTWIKESDIDEISRNAPIVLLLFSWRQ